MYIESHDHLISPRDCQSTGNVVSASRDLSAVIDRQCLIHSITPSFASLLGCERQDLIDQLYGHFITLIDLDAPQHLRFKRDPDPVIRCLNTAEGCLEAAVFLPGTEAGRPLLRGTLAPLFAPDGSVTGCLFIARHTRQKTPSSQVSGQRGGSLGTASDLDMRCICLEATGELNHEHRL